MKKLSLIIAICCAISLFPAISSAHGEGEHVYSVSLPDTYTDSVMAVKDEESFFIMKNGEISLYTYDGNLVYTVNTGNYNGKPLKPIQSVTVDGKSYFIAENSPHLYVINGELKVEQVHTFKKHSGNRYLVKIGDTKFVYACNDDVVLFNKGKFPNDLWTPPEANNGDISQLAVSDNGFIFSSGNAAVLHHAYNLSPDKDNNFWPNKHFSYVGRDLRGVYASEDGDSYIIQLSDNTLHVVDYNYPIENNYKIESNSLSPGLLFAYALSDRSVVVLTKDGTLLKLNDRGEAEWQHSGFSTEFEPIKDEGGILLREGNSLILVSNTGEKQTKIPEGFTYDVDQALLLNNHTVLIKDKAGKIHIEYFEETDLRVIKDYSDVNNREWYAVFVRLSVVEGTTSGYPDSTFRPSKSVTEAEALAMLIRMYIKEDDLDSVGTVWHDKYYSLARQYNWKSLKGLNNYLARNESITRGDLARLVANASGLNLSTNEAVKYLLDQNMSSGKTSKTIEGYAPSDKLTRAEAVKFLYTIKYTLENIKTVK